MRAQRLRVVAVTAGMGVLLALAPGAATAWGGGPAGSAGSSRRPCLGDRQPDAGFRRRRPGPRHPLLRGDLLRLHHRHPARESHPGAHLGEPGHRMGFVQWAALRVERPPVAPGLGDDGHPDLSGRLLLRRPLGHVVRRLGRDPTPSTAASAACRWPRPARSPRARRCSPTPRPARPVCRLGGGRARPQPVRGPGHRRGLPAVEVQRRQLGGAVPGVVGSRSAPTGPNSPATPTVLLTVDQADLPWETTFDDPQMVFGPSGYTLLFSAGNFLSPATRRRSPPVAAPTGRAASPAGRSSRPTAAWPVRGAARSSRMRAGPGGSGTPAGPPGAPTTAAEGLRRLFTAPIDLTNDLNVPCNAPAGAPTGYRLVASDGGIFTYGNLPFCGSTGAIRLNQPVVGMASTTDGGGYWNVARDGGVFAFGECPLLRLDRGHPPQPAGGRHGRHSRTARATGWSPPTAASSVSVTPPSTGRPGRSTSTSRWSAWPRPRPATATGWSPPTAASSASVTPPSTGRPGPSALNRPIVGMASTPSGHGYWLVASDGGIFSFGDAAFYGSTGAIHLNQPVVGMAATPERPRLLAGRRRRGHLHLR